MVAASALLDSLSTCRLGRGHSSYALECPPHYQKTTRTATCFEGKAASKKGGDGKLKKMGRTADEEPCPCTDPPKKKKHGGSIAQSLGFGGPSRDHQAVLDAFKKEQRAAERANANNIMAKPFKTFNKALKKLEGEIVNTESLYAEFRHKHDEYIKAYHKLTFAMAIHCKGLSNTYKGVKFDCDRERVEAQAQFLSRRRAPECLIGEKTPYDDLDEDGAMLGSVGLSSALPPEALVLGNLVAAHAAPRSSLQARSWQGVGRPTSRRHDNAAVRDFL
jgi:hypothetical protein